MTSWFEVIYDLLGFKKKIMFWFLSTENEKSKDSSNPSLMYIITFTDPGFLSPVGPRDNFVGRGEGGCPMPIFNMFTTCT